MIWVKIINITPANNILEGLKEADNSGATMKTTLQNCLLFLAVSTILLCSGCTYRFKSPSETGTFGSYEIDNSGPKKPAYNSYVSETERQYILGAPLEVIVRESISAASRAGGQSQLNAVNKKLGPFERPLILSEVQKMFTAAGYNYQPNAKGVFTLSITKYGLYKNRDGTAYAAVSGIGMLRNSNGKLFEFPGHVNFSQAIGRS